MKIDNMKIIMKVFFFLLFIILFILIYIVFFLFFKKEYHYVEVLLSLLLLLLVFITVNLKYFIFENSGEVVSIRYLHPFLKSKNRIFEFPISKISEVKFEKFFFSYITIFKLKRDHSSKSIHLHFILHFFSNKQIQAIHNSINKTIKN